MLAHAIVILFAHLYAFVFPEVALAATSFGVLTKRDDNLPARVPYVFPPPGTDSVSSRSRKIHPH